MCWGFRLRVPESAKHEGLREACRAPYPVGECEVGWDNPLPYVVTRYNGLSDEAVPDNQLT